jgi:hypothetical protein
MKKLPKSKTKKTYESYHESRESKRKESSEKPRASYKAPYKNKGY